MLLEQILVHLGRRHSMKTSRRVALSALCLLTIVQTVAADVPLNESKLNWQTSYYAAMEQAKAEQRLMLIHFFRPADQTRKEAA
jgi:hypothetical protein